MVKFRSTMNDDFKMALLRHFKTNFTRKAPIDRSFYNQNVETLFLKIRPDIRSWQLFKVDQQNALVLWSLHGCSPTLSKDRPFSAVMVIWIAKDSMNNIKRKKRAIDSWKKELCGSSTAQEWLGFVLQSREVNFFYVLPCNSDVWEAFSSRFSKSNRQRIDLCNGVSIVAIQFVVAELVLGSQISCQ